MNVNHVSKEFWNLVDESSSHLRGKIMSHGSVQRPIFSSLDQLIEDHFSLYSEPSHPCRPSLHLALDLLYGKPAVIFETGSSAWGSNSSLLFDSYVNSFGGEFFSVDLRVEPMMSLSKMCSSRTQLHCDDSVAFLKRNLSKIRNADLVYLDSWDVDWSDPLPSAIHGFHEFMTILPCLKPGALLLVDDTPRDSIVLMQVQPQSVPEFLASAEKYLFIPGKGGLIKKYLENNSIGSAIEHQYQLLWKF